MSENTRTTAVGVFEDRRHAHLAVEALLSAGFSLDQIGFIIPEERLVVDPPKVEPHTRAEEGAVAGAAAGGTLGGLLGIALATAFIPGVGMALAGGLLAAAAAGAVAGVASGGLVGTLIGMSIPEEDAKTYEREFHSGRTLVTVQAGGRYEEAATILQRAASAPDELPHPHVGSEHMKSDLSNRPGLGNVFIGE